MAVNFLDGITVGGDVGIGTTSPATKLHVSNGDIRIDNSKRLEFGSGGVRINNDASGRMYQKAPLDFYWETQGYTMVLRQSGNLGIGTTSPSQKLTVAGTIMSTATSNATLILQDTTHSDITIKGDSGIFSVSNGSAGQNITMLYDGRVGIGTTTPSTKLDVDGKARFRSDTSVDKAFMADSYVSSANGPFGPQPGINAVAVIPTKAYQITLTFASGLLIGYVCEGEECPEQPPNIFMEEG